MDRSSSIGPDCLVIQINQFGSNSAPGVRRDQIANAFFDKIESLLFVFLQQCGAIGNDNFVCSVSHQRTFERLVLWEGTMDGTGRTDANEWRGLKSAVVRDVHESCRLTFRDSYIFQSIPSSRRD